MRAGDTAAAVAGPSAGLAASATTTRAGRSKTILRRARSKRKLGTIIANPTRDRCWLTEGGALMHVALAMLLSLVAMRQQAQSHPFSFADMIAMQRVSELAASPDGAWLAFVVRTYSLEQNKGSADLW